MMPTITAALALVKSPSKSLAIFPSEAPLDSQAPVFQGFALWGIPPNPVAGLACNRLNISNLFLP